jgi:hypothetical protein
MREEIHGTPSAAGMPPHASCDTINIGKRPHQVDEETTQEMPTSENV